MPEIRQSPEEVNLSTRTSVSFRSFRWRQHIVFLNLYNTVDAFIDENLECTCGVGR